MYQSVCKFWLCCDYNMPCRGRVNTQYNVAVISSHTLQGLTDELLDGCGMGLINMGENPEITLSSVR